MHGSWQGCLFTLVLMTCLISYGTIRYLKMMEFDDTDVMLSHVHHFYNEEFVYDGDQLSFAFGLTGYNEEDHVIQEDPTIGTWHVFWRSWGLEEDYGTTWQEIETRPCTEAELHINGKSDPNSSFFKPARSSVRDLRTFWRELRCLDETKFPFQGDYNSPKAKLLGVRFDRCNP